MFTAKVGTLVRVYIREHSFPHKNARLFFEGTLKEIVQRRNSAADVRFRDGYVILKGNFSTRLGGKWKRSEHKKIAIGDITRILEVKLPEMAE